MSPLLGRRVVFPSGSGVVQWVGAVPQSPFVLVLIMLDDGRMVERVATECRIDLPVAPTFGGKDA